ncbi:putative hydrolase, CocE/NonD family [Mycolicibacterium chubuense NBB4]|uniref:Putative hydrolase, CocE/NonD family n=1 Tax=Mycolicibacterium chubuense (strain NBB4) TaxID=710421 RepID=I4BK93_MYCCN|nr:CocE/NonD family hydrolase [Mycolicibacterium chubuense]AFM17700.1 putative hydrolase, CocE/NonD family [Mycolicibacterium chubuense NBB4]
MVVLTGCGAGGTGGTAAPGSDHGTWPASSGRGSCGVTEQADVPARMRDGTVLRADVYRPRTGRRVPVILMRTQYGKDGAQVEPSRYQSPDWFASHCYLVVVQDIRGQGRSGGVFSEFTNDQTDGYDSVEWAAGLPGSNGKVGMYGSSYVGATQWLAAVTAPPHLVTIVPANTASDYYDGWTYEGGEFRLGFVQPWAIGAIATTAAINRGDGQALALLKAAQADPTRWLDFRPFKDLPPLQPGNPAVAPWYFDWIRHSTRDDFWRQFSIRDRYSSVTVPVMHFEGWYDAFLAGGIENFAGMTAHGGTPEARRNQRLIIGPWDHISWGRATSEPAPLLKDIGPGADSPINEMMLAWYDHFLKGVDNGMSTGPRVDYFVMGANVWRSSTSWPLPQTRWTTYYLAGAGGIADRNGALQLTPPGDQPPDTFTYDPAYPAPSLGGHSCCGALSGPQGPYDQTPVEQRSDVLVYSSDPVSEDTEVTGPVTVDLWAQSSAPDTDFTAKLAVVHPDGAVVNLNDGIIRTAFRDSLSAPRPTVPNQPYRYRIAVWPTSYEFRRGDRIRVEVSSSDYPQFAPNPNTGAPFGQDAEVRPATQTILHDRAHPSAITLPVIPAAGRGSDTFPAPPHASE